MNHSMAAYKGTSPVFDVRAFFDGPIKGWGLIEGRSSRVLSRFDVDMTGSWAGDTGTLVEHFRYYDGKTQDRTWTIVKKTDGTYSGTASDIIGSAKGASEGTAMRWVYAMDLNVSGRTYRIGFDDWMFQMNDGIVINRSYLKKFGFTVAELTLFMQKQKS